MVYDHENGNHLNSLEMITWGVAVLSTNYWNSGDISQHNTDDKHAKYIGLKSKSYQQRCWLSEWLLLSPSGDYYCSAYCTSFTHSVVYQSLINPCGYGMRGINHSTPPADTALHKTNNNCFAGHLQVNQC